MIVPGLLRPTRARRYAGPLAAPGGGPAPSPLVPIWGTFEHLRNGATAQFYYNIFSHSYYQPDEGAGQLGQVVLQPVVDAAPNNRGEITDWATDPALEGLRLPGNLLTAGASWRVQAQLDALATGAFAATNPVLGAQVALFATASARGLWFLVRKTTLTIGVNGAAITAAIPHGVATTSFRVNVLLRLAATAAPEGLNVSAAVLALADAAVPDAPELWLTTVTVPYASLSGLDPAIVAFGNGGDTETVALDKGFMTPSWLGFNFYMQAMEARGI